MNAKLWAAGIYSPALKFPSPRGVGTQNSRQSSILSRAIQLLTWVSGKTNTVNLRISMNMIIHNKSSNHFPCAQHWPLPRKAWVTPHFTEDTNETNCVDGHSDFALSNDLILLVNTQQWLGVKYLEIQKGSGLLFYKYNNWPAFPCSQPLLNFIPCNSYYFRDIDHGPDSNAACPHVP